MSEKEKIKQFEKEQLNKLLIELKNIDNFKGFEDGAFKYSLGKYQADLLLEHIDKLQQEHNILTEFEKWLEEAKKHKKARWQQFYKQKNRQEIVLERLDAQILFINGCLDKLQELKGINNEKSDD